jgi:hypothetical protein
VDYYRLLLFIIVDPIVGFIYINSVLPGFLGNISLFSNSRLEDLYLSNPPLNLIELMFNL